VASLSQAIQLSVAPVFLLIGIAGLLNIFIFTARLARVVGRARALHNALERVNAPERAHLHDALLVQRQRTFLSSTRQYSAQA